MPDDILIKGLDLLLYGMGTVIVFLSVLVALTSVMSRTIAQYFPEPESTATPEKLDSGAPVSALTLRILQAAVDRHRG